MARFLIYDSLLCQESIVLDIRNGLPSTGVLFHYFDRFLSEYESRFQREYGFFRPIIKEVVEGHHEAPRAVVISQCFA
jgi:hypothetical protein